MNVLYVFVVSFALIILGVGIMASVMYQETIEEPLDYHMGLVRRHYEWRTRAPVVAMLGGVILVVGLTVFAWVFIDVVFLD
jgi:hypothetical protein